MGRLLTVYGPILLMLLMSALGCRPLPTLSIPAHDSVPVPRAASPAEAAPDETLKAPHRLDEPAERLELLEERDEGPADGLSLEAAIDRLLSANSDLAAKYQDIPKARADVLTAGLRNDPVVFLSAAAIPYGHFSVQRPGATTYDVTIVQPLDVSGKHKANRRAAEKKIPILEARFQDEVRREIDRLYAFYVNVLEARAMMRAARAARRRLAEAAEISRRQIRQGRRPSSDDTRAAVRQASADIALRRAETALLHARRNLAVLLALPAEEADRLRVRGSLYDRAPPPPSTEEMISRALGARPDLQAHQLSVDRARAELQRERTEAVEDVFLFFSPYEAANMNPQGKQSITSWQIGVLLPISAFNRNQGEIVRARANVTQWRIEVERAQQEVIDEVRRAATEYTVSRQLVQQYEQDILLHAHRLHEDSYRRFVEEQKDLRSFLSAHRDYQETIRDYLEALARHRRAMLRLNTVVGQRLLP